MGRWEPDAVGRLRGAAMGLFAEQGYEQTTVAEIAERAGLTARTFFRYFGDKREVLFAGSEQLQSGMVEALAAAPVAAAPMTAVEAALAAAAEMLGHDRDWSIRRHRLIVAHADLRERELIKLASLADRLAAGLRERGTAEPTASLAAEAGVAVMRVAFERWVADGEERALDLVMTDALEHLRAATR